ncbi:hypothetical protein [Williamsia sp. 1135]|uniref:hypothetical protein n=1 Tax=Williamsia sp. 1135 TaxID=1889262 RepID=UPI00117E9E86|nr:hypothetical protein [Williamsia sp. 1135]
MTISESGEGQPPASEGLSPVVAIVHATADGVPIIWYVNTDPVTDLNRLCGAWVTPDADQHKNLLTQRWVLQFAGSPVPNFAAPRLRFDANRTRQAIIDEVDHLGQLHRATPTKSGASRAAIEWPDVPGAVDFTNVPPVPRGVSREDPAIADTVAVAYWLQELVEAWSRIETIRCGREHLRGDTPTPRGIPLVAVS